MPDRKTLSAENAIEVAPISSARLRIACLVILYKTCRVPDQELAAATKRPVETTSNHVGGRYRSDNITPNRGTNSTRISFLTPMARKRIVEEYRPTSTVARPEEYRRLADKCREVARTASAEKERAD